MQICPFCASENIFFSKKRCKYYCEDCETGFETPAMSKGMRVFLSYGHDKNTEVVKKIKSHLVEKGYDVWIDTSEIHPGKDWRERITNGLIGSNGVVFFLSKHSVRDPGVCLDELKIAVCLKHAYIKTVLLENESEVEPPKMVRHTQWIDMSNWDSVSVENWDDYFEQKMALLLESLNSDEAVKFNGELEFLSGKLEVSNNTSKEQRLLRQTFVGRGWLMEKINQWLASPYQDPFMIYGVPGAGKSAFSANLAQFNPDVLAALFFEWDHSEFHSTDAVIKHLAFRLSVRLADYRRMLCNLYGNDDEKKKLEQYHGAALFDHIILNPLQCCIDGNRETGMIVLDGLDEASGEVTDILIRKAAQMPSWIKVLFTSRYDASTASRFKDSDTVILDESLDNNYRDIKEYLAYRLDLSIDSETVCRLADKSEGSFMYAVAFCDAIDNGSMSLDDAKTVPAGLNSFYYSFFKRLFETRESFNEVRPFLELLCVEDDVPEEVITECLELDRYGLWELRLNVKSLVTNAESTCGSGNAYKFKTVKLVHQSIKDWLISSRSAGEFFVDVTRGYGRLARYSEKLSSQKNQTQTSEDSGSLYKKLQTLDPNNISEAQLKELQKEIELRRAENDATEYKRLHNRAIISYASNNYIKWLVLGGKYDKAKALLLSSFDEEAMDCNHNYRNYQEYYKFFNLWQWADMFPLDYPIDELVGKFTEIALYPKKYIVSEYAHRSFQIAMLTLRYIMDSGRYRNAYYELMKFYFAGYFTSGASDEGETRDGWDKYYLTRDAVICLKKLDRLGVFVPPFVRANCERMKLTFHYYHGDPFRGGSGGFDHLLRTPELYKDICVINEDAIGIGNTKELLIHYNTTSLRLYLEESDEEDLDFIKRCITNHADLAVACNESIENINNRASNSNRRGVQPINIIRRLDFIRSLLKTLDTE